MINLEEFKRFEFIVAQIQDVQEHSNADKLYVLKIDTGQEVKQLVAGIRSSYTKEALLGKRIIVINNLEPAVIRGVESQGMLLATSDDQGISIISPDRDVALGSVVR